MRSMLPPGSGVVPPVQPEVGTLVKRPQPGAAVDVVTIYLHRSGLSGLGSLGGCSTGLGLDPVAAMGKIRGILDRADTGTIQSLLAAQGAKGVTLGQTIRAIHAWTRGDSNALRAASPTLGNPGFISAWRWLNSEGRHLNHLLGDLADAIAMAGVALGIHDYVDAWGQVQPNATYVAQFYGSVHPIESSMMPMQQPQPPAAAGLDTHKLLIYGGAALLLIFLLRGHR